MRSLFLALIAASGVFVQPAAAAVVDFSFSGIFTSGDLSGQAFSGQVSYDTTTAWDSNNATQAAYYAVAPSTFTYRIGTTDYVAGAPSAYVRDTRGEFFFQTSHVSLNFQSGANLVGRELPTFAEVEGFALKSFSVSASGGSSGFFTVTNNVAAAIPEPATWSMMIGGFGLVGGAMRRRRQAVAIA